MNHKLRTTLDWIELPINILNMYIFKRKVYNQKSLDFLEDKKFPHWRKESKPIKIIVYFLKLKLKK